MSVAPGTVLGSYEIRALAGIGGMGEVYRARDLRLDRDVAIKLLPDVFAVDADRRSRLEREAKLLATLNHPSIASIYGFEREAASSYLVMEFVEGETLADAIARAPLAADEVIAIFLQLAEALDAAHARGIIHRDLKPANIKLTPEGRVKVLDFGLARAVNTDLPASDPAQSPTISYSGTQRGVILGTAAYMSPEQARGRAVDARADIWALGCVLFEALSGRRVFPEDTTTDILAAVLRADPDWSALPAGTPPRLRRVIERCLQKDPAARWANARDLVLAFNEPESLPSVERDVGLRRRFGPLLLGSIVAGALLGASLAWWLKPAPTSVPRPLWMTIQSPEGWGLNLGYGSAVTVSPDGRSVVFAATRNEHSQLYLRRLDGDDLRPIAGTDRGRVPVFSPDGASIAFVADSHLKKVRLDGGASQTLCDISDASRGVSWPEPNTIVVNPGRLQGLLLVPAAGGAATAIRKSGEADVDQRWPEGTPDGRTVLVTEVQEGLTEPRIVALDVGSGRRREITSGTEARFVPPDLLFFARSDLNAAIGSLWVARVDPATWSITEGPALISENLRVNIGGAAHYAVSRSLDVALARVMPERDLTILDRGGRVLDTIAANGLQGFSLADDDRHLVGSDQRDLWIYDLERRVGDRVTNNDGAIWTPLWFPGSRRVAYAFRPTGTSVEYQIVARQLDGTATPQVLGHFGERVSLGAITSDGNWLLYYAASGVGWIPFVTGAEAHPEIPDGGSIRFSPDGRLIAFAGGLVGRVQVYVQRVGGGRMPVRVSLDGGNTPQWTRDGRELVYRYGNQLVAADIRQSADGQIQVGAPRVVVADAITDPSLQGFAVTRDGSRIIVLRPSGHPAALDVLINWKSEIDARLRSAPPVHGDGR